MIYYVMARFLHIPPEKVDEMELWLVNKLVETYIEEIKEQERAMKNGR